MRAPKSIDATILARANGMEAEILHEKAATLQRISAGFQAAMEALRAFDRSPDRGDPTARERLLNAAGEALWYYVIQREVSGLRDTEQLMRELAVPREVQLRMGIRSRAPERA